MNQESVIDSVRRAFGRTAPLESVPPPPPIDEPITRFVHADIGLPELFAKRAAEMKMETELLSIDHLIENLITYLKSKNINRIMLSDCPLFRRLRLSAALRSANFDAHDWSELTLDESYDFDCALTDTTFAVAEIGGFVIQTTASHGRALTLVPMYHIAIVEPKNLLPDMVDLFLKLTVENPAPYTVLITGPSKTADIEMNVVTGVHGPNIVKAYILK